MLMMTTILMMMVSANQRGNSHVVLEEGYGEERVVWEEGEGHKAGCVGRTNTKVAPSPPIRPTACGGGRFFT